ncbi:hypothetical protein INT45_005273 [Circinella minor]|uniref:OB domain-containing protein n=1 Tax=Circinella minor TaxID=1195481 RepID=A0A8H7VK07_9FUNG|nr:hypothetical protein INT45_005273 [Circinella minor]
MAGPAPPINQILLKDMKPGQRGITSDVIVIKKEPESITTREGEVIHKYIVADKTGSMSCIIWHAFGKYVRIGDILRIQDGECKLREGRMQFSVLRTSKLKRMGQDTLVFIEEPNFSDEVLQGPPMSQGLQQQQQHLPYPMQHHMQNLHHQQQQQQQSQLQHHQHQQRMPYPRSRPGQQQHQQQQPRGGYRGRGRDPRQRGRSTPQPQ